MKPIVANIRTCCYIIVLFYYIVWLGLSLGWWKTPIINKNLIFFTIHDSCLILQSGKHNHCRFFCLQLCLQYCLWCHLWYHLYMDLFLWIPLFLEYHSMHYKLNDIPFLLEYHCSHNIKYSSNLWQSQETSLFAHTMLISLLLYQINQFDINITLHPSIHSSIHPFIHLSIHPSIYGGGLDWLSSDTNKPINYDAKKQYNINPNVVVEDIISYFVNQFIGSSYNVVIFLQQHMTFLST